MSKTVFIVSPAAGRANYGGWGTGFGFCSVSVFLRGTQSADSCQDFRFFFGVARH